MQELGKLQDWRRPDCKVDQFLGIIMLLLLFETRPPFNDNILE
jgi:hypothetical protein